jgi:hypothetical protein
VAAPAGYVRIGGFEQQLDADSRGSRPVRLKVVIWQKQ